MCTRALAKLGSPSDRVNFVSRGIQPDRSTLIQQMKQYADLVRPYGWVLQMYIPMSLLNELGNEVNALG